MSRLVFVTTELHPETPGGAGTVVDSLASGLSETRQVLVLLLTADPVEVSEHGRETLVRSIPHSGFLERSKAAAKALGEITRVGDRVEFQDFEGIGFWALAHRSELGLDHCILTVRFHGPYDLLAQAMDTRPLDWEMPRAMEREAFRMADGILIPAPGHRPTLVDRYGAEPERITLAPPPVPPVAPALRGTSTGMVFAVVGRLGEMKGQQDVVRSALTLLDQGVDLSVRFIGGDGWSTTATASMKTWLLAMIGDRHRDRFEFTGHVDREELADAMTGVTAVVVPSRFESFCLAAHEARQMGLPVIVPDLRAFSGLLDERTGALVYDGTQEGLEAALRRFVLEPDLAREFSRRPVPDPGSPWVAYHDDPTPRHPRAQAGLGTAAMQRVEEIAEPKRAAGGGGLQRLYRYLPVPIARLAARLVPQPLKNRFRSRASWPAEEARRGLETRLARVEKRIMDGEFSAVPSPDITVVVPVHDDVRFLPETLASVYEQTYDSWEIIIVDDGSRDQSCLAMLDSFADRPRVRVIHQTNLGLPGARNAGIQQARGHFVIPLDSDDELVPDFMARMVAALEEKPLAAYAHCHARLYHDIDAIWITRPFNPYWQVLGNGVVGCVLLRREAWEQVGGYDETMTSGNEDWEFWVRLMEAGWDQATVPEVLFNYRKHGISMSVETEAQFEEGRRMVRDRHPDLYARDSLGTLKSRWYPLVTALVEPGVLGTGDMETITGVADLSTTWGKYVVDLRGLDRVPFEVLDVLARTLEEDPSACVARTDARHPLEMWRRWNLHDQEAPATGEVSINSDAEGRSVLPRRIPRPGWSIPQALAECGLPVQRQPPEESGYLPDVEAW